jgi:hypothetical protein
MGNDVLGDNDEEEGDELNIAVRAFAASTSCLVVWE